MIHYSSHQLSNLVDWNVQKQFNYVKKYTFNTSLRSKMLWRIRLCTNPLEIINAKLNIYK